MSNPCISAPKCLLSTKGRFFIGWIPSIACEENYETAISEFLKLRVSQNKCYIQNNISTSNNSEIIENDIKTCSVIERKKNETLLSFKERQNKFEENLKKALLFTLTQKYQFDPNTKYEVFGYPKKILDKPVGLRKIVADNVVLIIGKKTEEPGIRQYLCVDTVIILDISFVEFISICTNSNFQRILYYGIGKIWDMDLEGLVLFQSFPIVDLEKIKNSKIDPTLFRSALARLIYSILCDIYLVKLFHNPEHDVVNDIIEISDKSKSYISLNCTNYVKFKETCKIAKGNDFSFSLCPGVKEYAKEKIRRTYSRKVATLTKKVTQYMKVPFYSYLSYGELRKVQDTIRLANGEMLYGKHFIDVYFDGDDKLLKQYDNALKALEIMTERIENKWFFTMILPLLSGSSAGIFYIWNIWGGEKIITHIIITPYQLFQIMLNPSYFFEHFFHAFNFYIFPIISVIIILILLIPSVCMLGSLVPLWIGDHKKKIAKEIRRSVSFWCIKKLWIYNLILFVGIIYNKVLFSRKNS